MWVIDKKLMYIYMNKINIIIIILNIKKIVIIIILLKSNQ